MDKEIYTEAKKRMPSQREKLLEVLREAGHKGVLNTDLVDICIGYRSRIAEMYQMGYKVDVEHIERGVCIYTLLEEPVNPVKDIPTATSVVISEIENKFSGAITADTLIAILKEMNFNIVRKSGSHKIS